MNIQYNRSNSDGERRYVTGDLPVKVSNVSIYKAPVGDFVVQKFGKEFPELFVGIEYVFEELAKLQAKTIIVREGGTGIVPTLLALALPKIVMQVSLWSASHALLDRNFEVNLNRGVAVSVEKDVSHKADVCVLVHESFQSHDSVVEEIINLLNASATKVLYVISHKNKGIESVAELVAEYQEVSCSVVARGKGGARVLKFIRNDNKVNLKPSNNSYITEIAGISIKLETGADAFSKGGVDAGSHMLVQYTSAAKLHPSNIWDLGCGTGYLGIAAALIHPTAKVVLSDTNARVVEAAKINVANAYIKNRCTVVLSDGASEVNGEFDLIISNPPLHIPKQHLITILSQARRKLVKGGKMLLVIEDSRVEELRELLKPSIGMPKIVHRGGTHDILEISK